MNWDILVMVEVVFSKKWLGENEMQLLEEFLRKQEAIDNLLLHPSRVTFYIWGKQAVDYKILEGFKNKLEGLGYHDFIISAKEYKETSQRII